MLTRQFEPEVSTPELSMDQPCKLVQPLQHQTERFLQVFQGV